MRLFVPFVIFTAFLLGSCKKPIEGPTDEPFTVHSLDGRAITVQQAENFLLQQMEENKVPGLGFSLINNAEIKAEFFQGKSDARHEALVNKNTLFEAASLSKVVFSFYCFQLAKQGVIQLDSPIVNQIDYSKNFVSSVQHPYRDLNIYHDFKEGYTEEFFKKITPRMLLNHSSGLKNWWDPEPLFAFAPGSGFFYSDDGYILLQRVIEHNLQKTIHELISPELLSSWGMHNSSFYIKPMPANKISGHNKEGQFAREFWMSSEGLTHGSLATTSTDLASFLLHISAKTKADSFYREMLTPEIALGHPNLWWGPGFAVEQNSGKFLIWHWGNNTSTQNLMVYSPDDDWGFVLTTNSGNGLLLASPVMDFFAGSKNFELDKWVH